MVISLLVNRHESIRFTDLPKGKFKVKRKSFIKAVSELTKGQRMLRSNEINQRLDTVGHNLAYDAIEQVFRFVQWKDLLLQRVSLWH